MDEFEVTDEEIQAYLDGLLEVGALRKEIVNGEVVLYPTDLTETLALDLYKSFLEEVDEALWELLELGLVEVVLDDDLTAMYRLTDLGRQAVEEMNHEGDSSDPEAGHRGQG